MEAVVASVQGGSEPVVGLFALRTFRVSANGYLLPVSLTSADWAHGTCIARCGRGHPAPTDGCTCGIYSLRGVRDLRLQYWSARRLIAVVGLEGQTVEGSKGWRSQAARVVNVWIEPGHRGLPAEQLTLLRQHLPGVGFHTDLDAMLAGYPELVPTRRPRSEACARAARSWRSSVTRPPLPDGYAVGRLFRALAFTVLPLALLAYLGAPVSAAVIAGQLAAVLLVLAVVVMLCETPTQLITVLVTGTSPPLLLTPLRLVLRLFRPAGLLLTAGTLVSLVAGEPIPVAGIAWSAAGWAVLLSVERFILALAPTAARVRLISAARGAHPGARERRDWTPETLTSGVRRRGRRGVAPVIITPPPPSPPTTSGA